MSLGRVLALDPGARRIGVAVSDPLRITAQPLEVIDRSAGDPLQAVAQLVAAYSPELIVVGLPVGLSGREGPAAAEARRFGAEVAAATGCPVEFVDERFTTASAERALLEGGLKRRERRGKVDKVAAAIILRQYLERDR